MYPGSIFEFDDQSDIQSLPITEVRNMPLFGAIFTSDKGTEDWTRISGEDFFKVYGKSISFAKHGQPLLQAAMTINAGAELICKRLVADDATLANIAIYAKLTTREEQVQATDSTGAPLYEDDGGSRTTEVTGQPVMETKKTATISYIKKSVENVSLDGTATKPATVNDVVSSLKAKATEGEYLLYVITDIGRGVSKKRIRIVPNYKLSKSLDYVSYNFSVLEGSTEIESLTFSANPNLVVNGQSVSLQSMINTYSTQLRCYEDMDGIEAFVNALSEAIGISTTDLYKYDILFGCTNKGEALSNVTIDSSGLTLDYSTGQALENGKDGALSQPSKYLNGYTAKEEAPNVWSKQAIKALDGTFDKVIFNVDQYMINAWVDANYPNEVKRQIEVLAEFREDFMYFRDQGTNKVSYELIKDACAAESKSMFASTYPQSYDIIDPYSKRQIRVTIGYSLARLLVSHINNGSILPTAGMKYNMVIDDAIYGTLSYAPTICLDSNKQELNEKELMEDIHANYASYIDNQLVIETLYTSQEKRSQWSYINNVMGIQDVVKVIRKKCPASRYTFMEGKDLEKYKKEVDEVVSPYSNDYINLSLEYKADAMYSANKIFYAVLKVVYKDFIQTEWIKVTALSTATALQ